MSRYTGVSVSDLTALCSGLVTPGTWGLRFSFRTLSKRGGRKPLELRPEGRRSWRRQRTSEAQKRHVSSRSGGPGAEGGGRGPGPRREPSADRQTAAQGGPKPAVTGKWEAGRVGRAEDLLDPGADRGAGRGARAVARAGCDLSTGAGRGACGGSGDGRSGSEATAAKGRETSGAPRGPRRRAGTTSEAGRLPPAPRPDPPRQRRTCPARLAPRPLDCRSGPPRRGVAGGRGRPWPRRPYWGSTSGTDGKRENKRQTRGPWPR